MGASSYDEAARKDRGHGPLLQTAVRRIHQAKRIAP